MRTDKVQKRYEKASVALSLKGAFRARSGWPQAQVRRRKLHAEWLPMLQRMEDILEEFHPGNWDIHTLVETNYYDGLFMSKNDKPKRNISFWPVVRFPEVVLRNSKKQSHKLVDTFLKFQVKYMPDYGDNCFTFGNLQGLRATITEQEYRSSYNHSHFQGDSREFNWSHCCTGSGEINNLFATLNAKFDEDQFRLLMLQLTTYVSWESLEGHPYKRISDINVKHTPLQNLNHIRSNHIIDYGREILNYMQDEKIRIDWQLVEMKPKVINNRKFAEAMKFLGPDIRDYDDCTQGLVMYTDMQTGRETVYVPATEISSSPKKKNKAKKGFIPFRGKEFPFTLLEPEEKKEEVKKEVKTTTQFYINPQITNYVIGELEKRATRLTDPVRNGVTQHLKAQANLATAIHAEGKVSV